MQQLKPVDVAIAGGAAEAKNFTMRTGCNVRRVIHKDGKAVGLSYLDASGEEILQPQTS